MHILQKGASAITHMNKEVTTVIYPAIFSFADDGITITFPDLPGCVSSAHSKEEALYMARDALDCWLATSVELGNEIPEPTDMSRFKSKPGQSVYMVAGLKPMLGIQS